MDVRMVGQLGAGLLLAAIGGCDRSVCPAFNGENRCELGEMCEDGNACMSRNCVDGTCVPGCTTGAECAPPQACVLNETRSLSCSSTCGLIVDSPGFFCEDGIVVTCATAADPAGHCDSCGCSDGASCIDMDPVFVCDARPCRCFVRRPVGAECTEHDECESGNCSGTDSSTGPRLCQLAPGTPCTTSDAMCRNCRAGRCRQSCGGDVRCGSAEICVGNRTTQEFGCYTECTDDRGACTLAESCDFVNMSTDRYCNPTD